MREVVLMCFALSACASNAGTGGDAASDSNNASLALVGTWSDTTDCAVTADYASCDNWITFGADGSYAALDTAVFSASSAEPGCTATIRFGGFTWTATASQITEVAGSAATGTIERSGCTNASDNESSMSTGVAAGTTNTFSYTLTGTTLVLTGAMLPPGGTTYTRR